MSDISITYATHPTAFETPGGGEVQILQYRKHLAALGINVTLFDPWCPRLGEVDFFHYFSCYRGSENFIDELWRRGIPVVLSPTLWVEKGATDYPMAQIGQAMRMAGRIVCNSDMEGDLLSDTFSVARSKFATVYNGVDPAFMQPVDRESFRVFSGIRGDFILNVANVEPRKNQLRLIDAVRQLGLHLVMIGGIRDQGYFEECMALGQGCLTYFPPLPHDSELLRSAYAACSLFALPSMLETPGLAALEAACVGAKVLVTGIGCAREYLQDHAIYVDPTSLDSIVAGIESGLTFSDQDAARNIVRQKFTWPVVIERLLDVYMNRNVFCPALSARGFHLAEFEPEEEFWYVWSKCNADFAFDQSGILCFQWRAAQRSLVDVKINGELMWSGAEVGTEFSPLALVLPAGTDAAPPRVEFTVQLQESVSVTEDPRELGVMVRDVHFVADGAMGDVDLTREKLHGLGVIFEGLGLQSLGWYRATEDSAGLHVWSRPKASLSGDRPGVLTFDWRAAQRSLVDVKVNGELMWSGAEVGTEFSPLALVLPAGTDAARPRVEFTVQPQESVSVTEDPRELGVMVRDVHFVADGAMCDVNLTREKLHGLGVIFEGLGLQSLGWYRATEDSAGLHVWSRRRASLSVGRPGFLTFDWRAAQRSLVDVKVDGAVQWSGLGLGTEWGEARICIRPNGRGCKSRIDFTVTPVDATVRYADPRELGLALRNVSFSEEQQEIL